MKYSVEWDMKFDEKLIVSQMNNNGSDWSIDSDGKTWMHKEIVKRKRKQFVRLQLQLN